jgi:protein-S-isoprenylcysteine O-methyltransferase Ste14
MKKIISIPPNYFYFCIAVSIALYYLLPSMNLLRFPYDNTVGALFMVGGMYLVLNSYFLFVKHKTPEDYSRSKALVVEGIYKYSRNPMYVGGVVFLLGLSIALGNLFSFFSPLFFFTVMNLMFIPYEEEKNKKTFGKKFLDYKKRVRKWI